MPLDSRLENSLRSVEDELSLVKNQIQQTLLDIREQILDSTNPFILPAFPGLEGATDEGLSSATGAAGAPDAGAAPDEEAVEGETPAGDEEVEEEEIEEPGAEEEEIIENDLGSPDGEDIVVDAAEDPGAVEQLFDEGRLPEDEFGEDEAPTDMEEEEAEEADAEEPELFEASAAPQAERLDLIALASLVRWVAATLEHIGRARLEVLLDAYELSGRMSPEVKSVARVLCELADEDPFARIPVRDVVRAMMRLEGVLGTNDGQDSRLLSLVVEDEFEPVDGLVASLGLH